MNRRLSLYLALLLALTVAAIAPAWGQYRAERFNSGELNELVGPIALYPDPLIAQILPASTFVDDVQDAAVLVRGGGSSRIDRQGWDVSVRSVAHYPRVIYTMAERPDYTTALGQAYVEQPQDVMFAIQHMRRRARNLGYLRSTGQQQVIIQGDYVRVVPASPRYIYVPVYNPQVVYVRRAPSQWQTVFAFGAGLLIGSWLNRDVDWHRHNVYYHGWRGSGWVSRSHRYVTINNYYVNDRYRNRPVYVNRTVVNRNISAYRNDVRRNVGRYRPATTINRWDRTSKASSTYRTSGSSKRMPSVTGARRTTKSTTNYRTSGSNKRMPPVTGAKRTTKSTTNYRTSSSKQSSSSAAAKKRAAREKSEKRGGDDKGGSRGGRGR